MSVIWITGAKRASSKDVCNMEGPYRLRGGEGTSLSMSARLITEMVFGTSELNEQEGGLVNCGRGGSRL